MKGLFAQLQTLVKSPIPFLTTIFEILYKNSTKLNFLMTKNDFFCDVIFKNMSKFKNKRLICKTTTLGKTNIKFLTTILDFLYENSPKLIF